MECQHSPTGEASNRPTVTPPSLLLLLYGVDTSYMKVKTGPIFSDFCFFFVGPLSGLPVAAFTLLMKFSLAPQDMPGHRPSNGATSQPTLSMSALWRGIHCLWDCAIWPCIITLHFSGFFFSVREKQPLSFSSPALSTTKSHPVRA